MTTDTSQDYQRTSADEPGSDGGEQVLPDVHHLAPRIDFEGPGEYLLPVELYVKELINSPIEFGTVTIAYEDDDQQPEPGIGQAFWVEDVQVAMHPHHGLLVCGAFGTTESPNSREDFDQAVEQLEETRSLLRLALDESPNAPDVEVPIGLFLVAMCADEDDLPFAYERPDIGVCARDNLDTLCGRMITTMSLTDLDSEIPFADYGPRLVATVRSLPGPGGGQGAYTSALELMMSLQLI